MDDYPFNASDSQLNSNTDTVIRIPTYLYYTAMTSTIAILILGVIGNVMVPVVIIRTRDMHNSTNIFLINLSVADLLVLLICTPTMLVELNAEPDIWILGSSMCKIVPFVELTVAHASALTILAISFERYYATCKPLKAGYICTKTRAILICFSTWFLAAIVTSPILWIAEYKYLNDLNGPVCLTQAIDNWTIIFFIMIIIIFFIMPLFILIVIYSIISRKLIKNKGSMMRLRPTKPELNIKAHNQAVLMLGTVVVSFFLCLLPFRLLTLWIIFSSEHKLKNISMEIYYNLLYFCRIMLYLNSAINPILYNLMSTKFRKAFSKIICNFRTIACPRYRKSKVQHKQHITAAITCSSHITTSTNTSSSILSRNHPSSSK